MIILIKLERFRPKNAQQKKNNKNNHLNFEKIFSYFYLGLSDMEMKIKALISTVV